MRNLFLRAKSACAKLFRREEPASPWQWDFASVLEGKDDFERWQYFVRQLNWCDQPETQAFFKQLLSDRERLVKDLEGLDLNSPGLSLNSVKIVARLQDNTKLLAYPQHCQRMIELYKKQYPNIK